jgi:hypothetical protein
MQSLVRFAASVAIVVLAFQCAIQPAAGASLGPASTGKDWQDASVATRMDWTRDMSAAFSKKVALPADFATKLQDCLDRILKPGPRPSGQISVERLQRVPLSEFVLHCTAQQVKN